MPRSSAEMHRGLIHDIKEVEVVKQQEQESDKKDDEEGEEVKGAVEEVRTNAQCMHG